MQRPLGVGFGGVKSAEYYRFGAAESDTEGSLHTYGALLLTYNRFEKLILNDSKTLYASSDAQCQIRQRRI